MSFETDEPKVDALLKERGIQSGIRSLYDNPNSCGNRVPLLIEILDLPLSLNMHVVVATTLFAQNPNTTQKRQAVEALLEIIRRNRGEYNHWLSTLVLNEIANNIEASSVHEIGRMLSDEGYGRLRAELTRVLYKIANSEAISYLKRAVKDPVTAALALDALSRLHVEETLSLCDDALNNPQIDSSSKAAIKKTYTKLQRQLAKRRVVVPSHRTNQSVPSGLEEWSANLDASDLQKILRCIQSSVEGGFGRTEIAEMVSIADTLSVNQEVRFKFNVKFTGKETTLWVEVFCDDEDAFDLYVFGLPDLIAKIERATDGVLK